MSQEFIGFSVSNSPEIVLFEAKPGRARRGVVDQMRQLNQDVCFHFLNCSFEDEGVWAGVADLLRLQVEKFRSFDALLRRHSYELAHIFPDLRHHLGIENESLMELSRSTERTRNYATDRAHRIVQGLIDFLVSCIKLEACDDPICIVCDNFESASALGRQFFLELFRRRGREIGLTLVFVVDEGCGERLSQLRGFDVRTFRMSLAADPVEESGDRASAESQALELEQGVWANPDYLLAALPRMVKAWAEAGRSDKVVQWKALSLATYNHLGFYEDARRLCDAVLREIDALSLQPDLFPHWRMSRWNLVGNIYGCLVQVNEPERALAVLQDELLREDYDELDRARLKYVLAMLYVRYLPSKDFELAESYIREGLLSLSELPPSLDVHFFATFLENGLALVAHRQGRTAEAIELCSRGLRRLDAHLPPMSHRLHRSVLLYNIAQVYDSTGSWAEAVDFYSAAMKMDPNYSEYYNERGSVLLKMGRIEDAIQDYRKAIETSPPFFEVWANLGQALRQSEDFSAAIDAYSCAIDLDPGKALPYVGRAQCFEAFEQWEAALSDYSEALRIDPNQPYTLSNRAVIFFETGRIDSAMRDLEDAMALAPDEEDFRQNYAIAKAGLAYSL